MQVWNVCARKVTLLMERDVLVCVLLCITIQKTSVSLLLRKCREGKYIYYAEGGVIDVNGARTPKYFLAL
jgi:hypothetical protein